MKKLNLNDATKSEKIFDLIRGVSDNLCVYRNVSEEDNRWDIPQHEVFDALKEYISAPTEVREVIKSVHETIISTISEFEKK